MSTHVILVAFSIDADTRKEAMATLTDELVKDLATLPSGSAWWIAEDLRTDGSDNDSAVFVKPGLQTEAFAHLNNLGLTGDYNSPIRKW